MNVIQELYILLEKNNLWGKRHYLKRNEYLQLYGAVDTNLYYVVEGSLKIFIMDEEEERIVRFGYKHNIIASLDSFISEKPSDFYIQAIKRTALKAISKSHVLDFVNQDIGHRVLWNKILEQLVLQQIEREKDILTSSARERYHRVLKRSPQLFQQIPNRHIASYLRMSPETLSRLRKS